MMALLRKSLLFITMIIAVPAPAAEYLIDTKDAHASIDFRFKHLGISWITGEFKTFVGTFSYDAANLAAARVAVEVDPASIDTNHAERDKHLRGEKYLNVDKYPSARFVSTGVVPEADGRFSIRGDLTLHGVTRPITIAATRLGEGRDPWGGYRAGFEGTVTLNSEDFGFRLPPGNQVEMMLYLEGVRQ